MSILFDLMTLTYSATLIFPVAFPDLYNASRVMYVPVRPMPALSMYRRRFERIYYIKTCIFNYSIRETHTLGHWIMCQKIDITNIIKTKPICYFNDLLCSLRNIFFIRIYENKIYLFRTTEHFQYKAFRKRKLHVHMNNTCFTCNERPLENWSWFLSRDCGTPPEREDQGYRGRATWCSGTV